MDLLFHQIPDDGGLFPLADVQGRADGLGESVTGTGIAMVRYRRCDGTTGYGEVIERCGRTLLVADSAYRTDDWIAVADRTFTEVTPA